MDKSHGSPYDRGRADYYYHRGRRPHYWPEGTRVGEKVTDLTEEQLKEYELGFEEMDDKKDWR